MSRRTRRRRADMRTPRGRSTAPMHAGGGAPRPRHRHSADAGRRSAGPAARSRPAVWALLGSTREALAAVLVGAAMGLCGGGLQLLLAPSARSTPVEAGALVLGLLLAVAVGLRAPWRMAVSTADWLRARLLHGRGQAAPSSHPERNGLEDPALAWLVLSTVTLVAGIALAVAPVWTRAALAGNEWLGRHFVWPGAALWGLVALTAFVAGLLPLGASAAAAAAVHRALRWPVRWSGDVTWWALLGAGAGFGVSIMASRPALGGLLSAAAALPMLGAALCFGLGRSTGAGHAPPLPNDDYAPLRAASSTLAVGAAFVWLYAHRNGTLPAGAAMLACVGLGTGGLAHRLYAAGSLRAPSGFGGAWAGVGLLGALTTALSARAAVEGDALTLWAAGAMLLTWLAAGYALAPALQTAERPARMIRALGRTVVAVAAGYGLVGPLATAAIGAPTAAAAALLFLPVVAVGGAVSRAGTWSARGRFVLVRLGAMAGITALLLLA